MNKSKITLEKYEGVTVLRDDLLPGGTKSVLLEHILNPEAPFYVYASPVYGGFQIALAEYAGPKAHIFCARRNDLHPNTQKVIKAGGVIHEVYPGYLSVVEARAWEWVKRYDAQLIDFGAKSAASLNILTRRVKEVVAKLGNEPDEIWCAIGSGLLFESILRGTSKARVCGLAVGKDYEYRPFSSFDRARAFVYKSDKPFAADCRTIPPFPSMLNYDAKAWEWCLKCKTGKNILFWNVL